MCLCIQQTLSALIKTYLPQVTHPLISTCKAIYFFLFSLFQYPLSAFFCFFLWVQPCQKYINETTGTLEGDSVVKMVAMEMLHWRNVKSFF